MSNVKFVPEKFYKVNANFNKDKNECSPYFNDNLHIVNVIEINIPQKIIIKNLNIKNNEWIFPVCIFTSVSYLRTLKYENYNNIEIFIRDKKFSKVEEILSGPVYEKNAFPVDVALPPWYDEQKRQRAQEIAEAVKLTDKELNNSTFYTDYININLLDYINFPIKPSEYEVWITYYKLESSRKTVEIIIDN